MRGYSDMGGRGWTSLDYPWMVTVTLASADTLTWGGGGGGGGGEGWTSLDYPWMVTVTLASADTLTRGGRVDIPGLSMGGHSYSGIHGYTDKGGGGGGRVDFPGLSMDGHSYSGIRGYSDMRGGGEGWTSLDYPWMVTVTLASADTLTRGGGGEGWTSLDYPWMVRVTPAYRDTLTRGGGRGHPWTIHGWSQLLRHVRIWGGVRVDIRWLSRDGHSYSSIRGYSDMEGEGGHPWTIHGWSRLLSAKYKATVSIHGWQRIVYGTIGHICEMLLPTTVERLRPITCFDSSVTWSVGEREIEIQTYTARRHTAGTEQQSKIPPHSLQE